jgi:hypothetical protein
MAQSQAKDAQTAKVAVKPAAMVVARALIP